MSSYGGPTAFRTVSTQTLVCLHCLPRSCVSMILQNDAAHTLAHLTGCAHGDSALSIAQCCDSTWKARVVPVLEHQQSMLMKLICSCMKTCSAATPAQPAHSPQNCRDRRSTWTITGFTAFCLHYCCFSFAVMAGAWVFVSSANLTVSHLSSTLHLELVYH